MTVICYNINMEEKRYKIKDLCELTGYSRRTIRFYVEQGLISPPSGRGRGGFYFDTHLKKLNEIRVLQNRGMSLNSIIKLLNSENENRKNEEKEMDLFREVWISYEIIPGFKIVFNHEFEKKWGKKIVEFIRLVKSFFENKN